MKKQMKQFCSLALAILILMGLFPVQTFPSHPDEEWYREEAAQPPLSLQEQMVLNTGSGPFSGGSGTVQDPYLVATARDVQTIVSYDECHFRQVCDISMAGYVPSNYVHLTGSYDGNGFTITDIRTSSSFYGLFYSNSGTIKNLHLKNIKYSYTWTYSNSTQLIGGLVRKNSGVISNCTVSGVMEWTMTGDSSNLSLGGIAGENSGLIENCKTDVAVTGQAAVLGYVYAGGIAGKNTGTMKNCKNEGAIKATNSWNAYVGGIAGYNQGTMKSLKNTGSIFGCTGYDDSTKPSPHANVGGIVGGNRGSVSYGENHGTVQSVGLSTGGHANAGGIIGYNGGSYTDAGPYVVEYSKNYGEVLAESEGGEGRAGGITSTCYKNSYVRYCCNQGNIKVTNSQRYNLALAGGLAGALQYGTLMQSCNHGEVYVTSKNYTVIGCGLADGSDGVIVDCYNTGNVRSDYQPYASYNYGILAALFYDNGTTCLNCYNLGDLISSGSANRKYGLYADRGGTDNNTVSGCYTTAAYRISAPALITADQATQKSTFKEYDFSKIWGMDSAVNNGHPYLRSIPKDSDSNWYIEPEQIVPVTGVKLDRATLSMEVGNAVLLQATVLPANALNKAVIWSSSKSSVATVDQNGLVTAQSPGTAVISVQTEEGSFLATCSVTVSAQAPKFSGGSGTASDPYLVATAQDLMDITYRRSAYYRQISNISLKGVQFLPIGSAAAPFAGVYDGGDFLITDLVLDSVDSTYQGIFGYSTGTISNVLMSNCTITAQSATGKIYCGAVVGYNTGTLRDCTVSGNLSATTQWEQQDIYIGGVCGYSASALTNCAFNGTVNAKVSYLDSLAYSGGIAGFGGGANNCQNYGRISAAAAVDCDVYVGGILAYGAGAISNCYNAGEIHASDSRYSFAGGIAGMNVANISGCKNAGEVYSSTAYAGSDDGDPTPPEGGLAVLLGGPVANAGGITGSNYATVSYGENTGKIHASSTSSSAYAGGVVGYNNGNAILERSKNSGEVRADSTGGESRAGGIASSSHASSFVRYCCNTGDIYITDNAMYNSGDAGGVLAVLQYGTAMQCCSHGDVYVSSKTYEPQGAAIVGSCTDAVLKDCYSDGDVYCDYNSSKTSYHGVICGITGGNGNQVTNCYFTGMLNQVNSAAERWGLIKTWGGTANTLSNCRTLSLYKSTETNALMTDAQSKQQGTYTGFDFTSVWAIDASRNGGRPYLRNLPEDTASDWYSGPEEVIRVTGVTLDQTKLTLHIGARHMLKATVSPANADDLSVIWSSDKTNVVQVSQAGKLTAVKAGTAKVTVTTRDGGFSASCTVTVTGHSYKTVVTAPTCTAQGYTTHTCTLCSDSYVDSYVPAKGHSFTQYTSDGNATLYADGTKTALCDHGCGLKDTVTDVGSMLFPEKVTSNVYDITGSILGKVPVGTTVSELLAGLDWGKYCKVFDANGQVNATATVGTGMVLKLMNGEVVKQELTIVVTGDTSGDGLITVTDLLMVKAHLLQKTPLAGVYATAADTSGDGNVSVTDFVQIKAHILGKSSIQAR